MTQSIPRSEPALGADDTGARVRLLEVEPDLGGGLDAADLEAVRNVLVVPVLAVSAGEPPLEALPADAIAAIVIDGLLVCESQAFGRVAAHVFGPGDVIDPDRFEDDQATWRGLTDAKVAVLGDIYVQAARRFPSLLRTLLARMLQCQQELDVRASIVAMPRVEDRVLAMLSSFAVRWGHVTPSGLTLDLPVTHLLLGRLVGARRPTVSLALSTLREQRLLLRDDRGPWVLPAAATEWQTDGIPDVRADGTTVGLRVIP